MNKFSVKELLGPENDAIRSSFIDQINDIEDIEEQENEESIKNQLKEQIAKLELASAMFVLKHSNISDEKARIFLLDTYVLPKLANGHYFHYQKLTETHNQYTIEEFRQTLNLSIQYAALNIEAGNRENWYKSNLKYIKDICEALSKQHSNDATSKLLFELLKKYETLNIDDDFKNDLFKLAEEYKYKHFDEYLKEYFNKDSSEQYSKQPVLYAGKKPQPAKPSTLRRRKTNPKP